MKIIEPSSGFDIDTLKRGDIENLSVEYDLEAGKFRIKIDTVSKDSIYIADIDTREEAKIFADCIVARFGVTS